MDSSRHYKNLEVKHSVSHKDLKKAFLKKMLLLHPDKNINKTPEQMKDNLTLIEDLKLSYNYILDNIKSREFNKYDEKIEELVESYRTKLEVSLKNVKKETYLKSDEILSKPETSRDLNKVFYYDKTLPEKVKLKKVSEEEFHKIFDYMKHTRTNNNQLIRIEDLKAFNEEFYSNFTRIDRGDNIIIFKDLDGKYRLHEFDEIDIESNLENIRNYKDKQYNNKELHKQFKYSP